MLWSDFFSIRQCAYVFTLSLYEATLLGNSIFAYEVRIGSFWSRMAQMQ